MSEATVLYELQGNTALITLNRPNVLNAINLSLLKELLGALYRAADDSAASTVILTGAGRSFCAGEDLKESSEETDCEAFVKQAAMLQEVQRSVMRLGKPLICAVKGYAVGGGCEFAMSCDIRIAGASAVFGFPETEIGLTVTTAGTKLLSQLVGLGKAKELIFTGAMIGSEEALRLGLVNKVAPDEDVVNEAMSMAKTIGKRSSLALKLSREAIDCGLHSGFEEILKLEESHLLTCFLAGNFRVLTANKLRKLKDGSSLSREESKSF